MLPLTFGMLVAGPTSGYLSDRFGARPFATGGMIAAAVGFLLLLLLPTDFSYVLFALVLLLVGVSMGLVAGYAGGTVDLLLMRVIDALLAFPALLLAISITAALGPDIQNAMIAIGVVAIPLYARLTRAQVLSLRERDYVTAARAIGATPGRLAILHILPNIANALIVQATLTTAFAILQEAVLSFLGLGAQPPTPSWGQDINYNQRYITNLMWWGSVGPGMAIFLAVFAFNFLGDALRDWLDPQLRRRA
jgi:peptide/nickel transport system permease protein